MDVYCGNCGEPWETWHMRVDAIHEAIEHLNSRPDLQYLEKYGGVIDGKDYEQTLDEIWNGGTNEDLTPEIREAFKQAGYVFGFNVLVPLKCPACPRDKTMSKVEKERLEERNYFAFLMGDDMDGLECGLEDLERMWEEEE
jgi:hypothetical protein